MRLPELDLSVVRQPCGKLTVVTRQADVQDFDLVFFGIHYHRRQPKRLISDVGAIEAHYVDLRHWRRQALAFRLRCGNDNRFVRTPQCEQGANTGQSEL